jgi:pimeloyl-ACP methyl ester carboxylesterase
MGKRWIVFIFSLLFVSHLFAYTSEQSCKQKGEGFLFAGGECIAYKVAKGETKGVLNIVVHGRYKAGTNVLALYTPFIQDIALLTDTTTVAVALPGYSGSSTNHLQGLFAGKEVEAHRKYLAFLDKLLQAFKQKYHAKVLTYIGHSAGAIAGADLMGVYPGLIQKIALAGGRYKLSQTDGNVISAATVVDKMDKKAHFLLIYGTKDTISPPHYTQEFYRIAKKAGLHVKIVEAKGAVHYGLARGPVATDAIVKLISEN